jgi:hypothetical protein
MLILPDLGFLGCLMTTAPRSVSNSRHFLGQHKGSDSFLGGQARDRPASSAEHSLAEHFMSACGERVGWVDDPDLLVDLSR